MRLADHAIAILLGTVLFGSLPLLAQDAANEPPAQELLDRVRKRYSGLTDYHFEHQLIATVETTGEDGAKTPPQEVAKVDFELAVSGAERVDQDPKATAFPSSMQRCRMSARSTESSLLLVSNEQEAVLYAAHLKQFKRAPTAMRAIGGPTSATFFMAINTLPLSMLVDAPLEGANIVRREVLTVAGRDIECYVVRTRVERTLPVPPELDDRPQVAADAKSYLIGSVYLLFLGMHGLTKPDITNQAVYQARAADRSITVLLWIDKQGRNVWKTQVREELIGELGAKEHRTLVITDSYTKVKTKGPLPEELFRFEIVEGTQEVEKIGQP